MMKILLQQYKCLLSYDRANSAIFCAQIVDLCRPGHINYSQLLQLQPTVTICITIQVSITSNNSSVYFQCMRMHLLLRLVRHSQLLGWYEYLCSSDSLHAFLSLKNQPAICNCVICNGFPNFLVQSQFMIKIH